MDEHDSKLTRDIAPFGVRMPADLKSRVAAAAATNNRSMNAEIVATLQEKYPEPTVDDVKAALTALLARLDSASTLEEAKAAAQEVERNVDANNKDRG